MKGLLLFSILLIGVNCYSEVTSGTDDNFEPPVSRSLSDNMACTPSELQGKPLEIIISKSKKTLNVSRNGTQVEGYPVNIREKGFPVIKNVEPDFLKKKIKPAKGPLNEFVIYVKGRFMIRARDKSMLKALNRLKKPKEDRVDMPRSKMKRLWNCVNKMGTSNVLITVKE